MRENPPRVSAIAKWMATGGIAFWLPVYFVAEVMGGPLETIILNLAPLAGLAILAWMYRKHHGASPNWGWVLAGIYFLGPILLLAPGLIRSAINGTSFKGGWLDLFMLLPPMTLWLALLSGTIFAVLTATVVLPVLANRPPSTTRSPGSHSRGGCGRW